MKTEESSAELKIAPYTSLKIVLNLGHITLHLKKTDGIEMTYVLDQAGAFFNEDVRDFNTYQVIVNKPSDYQLELN